MKKVYERKDRLYTSVKKIIERLFPGPQNRERRDRIFSRIHGNLLNDVLKAPTLRRMSILNGKFGTTCNKRYTRIAHDRAKPMDKNLLARYLKTKVEFVAGPEIELFFNICAYKKGGVYVEAKKVPVYVLRVEPADDKDPQSETQDYGIGSFIIFKCPECESEGTVNFIWRRYPIFFKLLYNGWLEDVKCSEDHTFDLSRRLAELVPKW